MEKLLTDELMKMSVPELKRLIAECRNLTDTNCGWQTYSLKDAVIEMAKAQLYWCKIHKNKK